MSETLRCLITLEAVLFFSPNLLGGFIFFAFWISQVFWMFFYIFFFLCVSETLRCLITLEAVLFFSPNLLGGFIFNISLLGHICEFFCHFCLSKTDLFGPVVFVVGSV